MEKSKKLKKTSVKMTLDVILLAAGKGTRMDSNLPKALSLLGRRAFINHIVDEVEPFARDSKGKLCIVYSNGGRETIEESLRADGIDSESLVWAEQEEQKGTADAVQSGLQKLNSNAKYVIILYTDVPLIKSKTLQSLIDELVEQPKADLCVLTNRIENPEGYGHVIRDNLGRIISIVEHNNANKEEKQINEINSGVIAVKGKKLKKWLAKIPLNEVTGELDLPKIIDLAHADKSQIESVRLHNSEELAGANDRIGMVQLEKNYQGREARKLLEKGVAIVDPSRLQIRGKITAGKDVYLDVGVILEGNVVLKDNVYIGPYTLLRNTTVESGSIIEAHSFITDSEIGKDCNIGPFARIRNETSIGEGTEIGNFTELNRTKLGKHNKSKHQSYLGDVSMGDNNNIGVGAVTSNYDGIDKHKTVIGDSCFIGSNTVIVAPITLNNESYVGAGSVITKDIPAGMLGIGRAKQVNIRSLKRYKKSTPDKSTTNKK